MSPSRLVEVAVAKVGAVRGRSELFVQEGTYARRGGADESLQPASPKKVTLNPGLNHSLKISTRATTHMPGYESYLVLFFLKKRYLIVIQLY